MIQLFDTQLQVSLRALKEVVAPALRNGESHVVEQLHLVIATLEFARQRLPYTRSFYRLELQNCIRYAGEVSELVAAEDAPLAAELAELCRTGQQELDRPAADAEDHLLVTRKLRELIAAAVDRSVGKPYEDKLDQLVISHLKQFLPQQRSWFLPFGLDPAPEGLPKVEQIVERD